MRFEVDLVELGLKAGCGTDRTVRQVVEAAIHFHTTGKLPMPEENFYGEAVPGKEYEDYLEKGTNYLSEQDGELACQVSDVLVDLVTLTLQHLGWKPN